MSDDSINTDSSSSSTSPEKRRSTIPNVLPHQRSFEDRYSHMIHKQILETGVNKETLKRQINAYFCGGSFSISDKESLSVEDKDLDERAAAAAAAEDEVKSTEENAIEDRQVEEREKSPLHKAETVDIAELQGAREIGDAKKEIKKE